MKKYPGILTLMAEKNSSHMTYRKLTDELYKYYEIDDIKHDTNNAVIFKKLFMESNKNENESIAVQNFVSVRTIYRFIKDANDLALRICEKRKKQYGLLLTDYEIIKREIRTDAKNIYDIV